MESPDGGSGLVGWSDGIGDGLALPMGDSMDPVEVSRIRESLSDSIAYFASPAMYLGLSELVEMVCGGIFIDFSNSSEVGGV